MNKERILALAELIEKQPQSALHAESGFCMENFTHHCGTPACIAGWALAMKFEEFGPKLDALIEKKRRTTLSDMAAAYLEIDGVVSETLFFGDPFASQRQAVITLRNLAATGDVDWEAA